MKLQCKTATAETYFLINKDQFHYLQGQEMIFEQTDKKSKRKTHQTRVRIFWNSFQANGSKLQKDSIANGYFATSFEIASQQSTDNGQQIQTICGDEIKEGFYSTVVGKLKENHKSLMDRIRLVYLNPDKNRLIIVSRFYDGHKNVKACQEVLNKALGWQSTKGCCNLNRDYPFPLGTLTLFEDGRLWTELDSEDGSFLNSDNYKVEFDDESAMDYIGTKDNWVSFPLVADLLNNRQSKDLMNGKYNMDSSEIDPKVSEEEMRQIAAVQDYRLNLLSDDHIPRIWPFPLSLVARIAPGNFIRPLLISGCFDVVTMLNAYVGLKKIPFEKKDLKTGHTVSKMVTKQVKNGLFMIVEAPPANGKSTVTELYKCLFSKHYEVDRETYEQENLYNDKINRKGQNKESPEKPEFKITVLSPKASMSQLYDRIAVNGGRMMSCHSPELQDLLSSLANGSGKSFSAQFSSFLRMVKDHEDFSVDFKIANCKKGFHQGKINYIICTTPGVRQDALKDTEDGLVSRIWFVSLNKENGSGDPVFDDMTEEEQEQLDEFQQWALDSTYEAEEQGRQFEIEGSEFVYDGLKPWVDQMEDEAVEMLDDTQREFVRRAKDDVNAVGCILYLLFKRYHKDMSEKRVRKAVMNIVMWLAELRLRESQFRYQVKQVKGFVDAKPKINVYKELPGEFYLRDLTALQAKAGNVRDATLTVGDWIRHNKVKVIEDRTSGVTKYRKLNP